MSDHLIVLLEGRVIGRVSRPADGKLNFSYDREWVGTDDAYPLSLSMPLSDRNYSEDVLAPFLWGLLPDNEQVIDRWAQKFQVSARNPFALIANVGEDCAGAAQFVRPERLEEIRNGVELVEWLGESDVADRLRALRQDHAAWRLSRDIGQFSLAGAQPKTALLYDNGRWGVPSGRTPTTHILKPPTGQFAGHAENEHVCLALARALRLPAATSRVERFDDEVAIVVERYDRLRLGQKIVRIHQEDVCQALWVSPTRKYENEGGPGVESIVDLLRTYSSASIVDVEAFIDAIGFNWLIVGTDAHAKNYSLLSSRGPSVRLAPLYDVASILPYEEFDARKIRFAMKVGGEYLVEQVGLRQWQKLARVIKIDEGRLIDRLAEMAEKIPDALSSIGSTLRSNGLDAPIVRRLEVALIERAKACARVLGLTGLNARVEMTQRQ